MERLADRLLRIKEKFKKAEKEESQVEGRLGAEKKQLQEEYDCETVAEAKKEIKQLEKKLPEMQEELEKGVKELEEELG